MMNPTPARSAAPGFVDLQVNGCQGIDFSSPDLTVGDVRRATQALAAAGTSAYCPTVVTCALETYEQVLPVLAAAMDEPDLREHVLGIHMEGPFLSAEARGAHPPRLLRRPDPALLDRWIALTGGRIRILTLAPELDGAEETVRHAAAQGLVVSLGHHMAGRDAVRRAVKAGARCCTHLGNGIPSTLPRHPNPLWTQLAEDRLTGLFITDGHHSPAEFIRVALRAKDVERFIVTSDAACIAGLPPGEYAAMGSRVISHPDGRITLGDGHTLAGSSANMADCVAWLRSLRVLSEADLTRVTRTNALRLLGIGDA